MSCEQGASAQESLKGEGEVQPCTGREAPRSRLYAPPSEDPKAQPSSRKCNPRCLSNLWTRGEQRHA